MIVTYFGGLPHIDSDTIVIENFIVNTDGIVVKYQYILVFN